MEKLIIDRFEGDYAVCEREDRSILEVLSALLPEGAREGDTLIIGKEGFELDSADSEKRAERIRALADSLWEE